MCRAGTKVARPGEQCTVPRGLWYTPKLSRVNYGLVSPQNFCMYQYNALADSTDQDLRKSKEFCQKDVPGGMYVPFNTLYIRGVRLTSAGHPEIGHTRVLEMQAYANPAGIGTNLLQGISATGNNDNNAAGTDGNVATYISGMDFTWMLPSPKSVGVLIFALGLDKPGSEQPYTDVFIEVLYDSRDGREQWIPVLIESEFWPAYSLAHGNYDPTLLVLGGMEKISPAGYYAPPVIIPINIMASYTACPAGYPHSVAGAASRTECYSNAKSRPWTGSQVQGQVPTNCASVTEWNDCANPACEYTMYSNADGTGMAHGTVDVKLTMKIVPKPQRRLTPRPIRTLMGQTARRVQMPPGVIILYRMRGQMILECVT